MWNVTGYDWNAPPAAVIEQKVVRQMRGGDVILLHDGGHRAIGRGSRQDSNSDGESDPAIPRSGI